MRSLSILLLLVSLQAVEAAPRRDALDYCFRYPFLTTADLELRVDDLDAFVLSDGGPTLFRCPGVTAIEIDGQPATAKPAGPDLIEAVLPAGRHEVRLQAQPVGGERLPLVDNGPQAGKDAASRAAKLQPGDVLVIPDGVYTDFQAGFEAKGTAARPIVIRPATPGGVVFRRRSAIRLTGEHLVFQGFRFEQCGPDNVLRLLNADDCRVTQCQFSFCGSPETTFQHILRVDTGSDRARVDHCFWTGSKSMSLGLRLGAGVPNPTGAHFDHNLCRDIYRYWVNGQENIQLGQNQRGETGAIRPQALVEFNVLDHAWGDGEIICNKSSGNTIRYNLAAHCYRSAYSLRGGDGARLEGNIAVDNDDGVRVMGTRHVIVNNFFLDLPRWAIYFECGSQGTDMQVASVGSLVAHNTIVGCGGGIGAMNPTEGRPHRPTGNRLIDNLIVTAGGTTIDTSQMVQTVADHNLFGFSGSPTAPVHEGPPLLDLKLVGNGLELHPGAGSAALGAAADLPEVTGDRWGRPRPAHARSIGADEPGAPAGPEPVRLPPIPPAPLVAPELYCGRQLVNAPDGKLPAGQATLPRDIVLSFEWQPAAYASKAAVQFGDVKLSWGGLAKDGKPASTLTLSRGETVLADGADTVNYYQNFRYQGWMGKTLNERPAPDPQQWYHFTILKHGGRWIVLLRDARRSGGDIPVIACADRSPGSAAPAELSLASEGGSAWRKLQAWAYDHHAAAPPEPVRGLTAKAVGNGRIALAWQPPGLGCECAVYRAEAGEVPVDAAHRLVAGVRADGCDDFAVEAGHTYHYAVVTRNLLGEASRPAPTEATAVATGQLYRWRGVADLKPAPPLAVTYEAELGSFLWAPRGVQVAMTTPPAAGAEFDLRVPQAGRYLVWGLVIAPDEGSDSFYTALDSAPLKPWYTGLHPRWAWSKIAGPVELAAGGHTLHLRHREPGARLAAVLLTDDLAYDGQP